MIDDKKKDDLIRALSKVIGIRRQLQEGQDTLVDFAKQKRQAQAQEQHQIAEIQAGDSGGGILGHRAHRDAIEEGARLEQIAMNHEGRLMLRQQDKDGG